MQSTELRINIRDRSLSSLRMRKECWRMRMLCFASGTPTNCMHEEKVVPNHMHISMTCTSSAELVEGGRTQTEWLAVNFKERGRSTL